jgi:hypothetical protein
MPCYSRSLASVWRNWCSWLGSWLFAVAAVFCVGHGNARSQTPLLNNLMLVGSLPAGFRYLFPIINPCKFKSSSSDFDHKIFYFRRSGVFSFKALDQIFVQSEEVGLRVEHALICLILAHSPLFSGDMLHAIFVHRRRVFFYKVWIKGFWPGFGAVRMSCCWPLLSVLHFNLRLWQPWRYRKRRIRDEDSSVLEPFWALWQAVRHVLRLQCLVIPPCLEVPFPLLSSTCQWQPSEAICSVAGDEDSVRMFIRRRVSSWMLVMRSVTRGGLCIIELTRAGL